MADIEFTPTSGSDLESDVSKVLTYMYEHRHLADKSVVVSTLRDAVRLDKDDFAAVDTYLLQAKYCDGTLGGQDALRWLTPSGVHFAMGQRGKIVTPTNSLHPAGANRAFMLRAIDLARKSISEQRNVAPKVGAIIVRDGAVLGEAYRGEINPGEHAEFTLLERKLAGQTLAGTTLFTTLEPCTKRGKPKIPCASRIIERRIGKVYIGTLDRNPNIRGLGETQLIDAGIQIGRFDSDLIPIIEEMNRDFLRSLQVLRERSVTEMKDPIPEGGVGPNGFKLGYNDKGDKVEWVEEDGEVWPLVLRRNDAEILAEYNGLWEMVWWNRHQVLLEKVRNGEEIIIPESGYVAAKTIEEKYGKENLSWDNVQWGLLLGRMSALSWVMGADWDESLDT